MIGQIELFTRWYTENTKAMSKCHLHIGCIELFAEQQRAGFWFFGGAGGAAKKARSVRGLDKLLALACRPCS